MHNVQAEAVKLEQSQQVIPLGEHVAFVDQATDQLNAAASREFLLRSAGEQLAAVLAAVAGGPGATREEMREALAAWSGAAW